MRLRDRFSRDKRKPSTPTQRIGFAFFWLMVLAYAFFVPNDANWNTESHLYPAFAIVDRHTLSIDAYQQRLGDKSYLNGHYYSDKAPGLSLLAVPVYATLRAVMPKQKGQAYEVFPHQRYGIPQATVYVRYAITYVLLILPSALFAVLLWLFLSRFVAAGWALGLTAAYALGTIAYPFSVRFYSHQITAILLFSAFMLLYTRVRRRPPDRGLYIAASIAGCLAGYAVISEYPTAATAVLVGAYGCAVARERLRTGAAFVAGMIPSALACGAYNLAAFGKPFATGYMHTSSSLYHSNLQGGILGLAGLGAYGFRWPTPQTLWELTFGAYRGLFVLSPVLLMSLAGLVFMWRQRRLRPELWLCIAVVVVTFLLDASHDSLVNGWSGGTSVASRHLTPTIPFMILPIVFGLRSRWFQLVFSATSAVSVAAIGATVATVGLFGMTDHNPIGNELIPAITGGNIQPDWGNMLGLTGVSSLLPLVVLYAGLAVRIYWVFRHLPGRMLTRDRVIATIAAPADRRVAS